MRKIIFYLLLFICSSSYSQKPISQQAINDLANKAFAQYKGPHPEKARAAMNKYISIFARSGAAAAISSARMELKDRPDVINMLNRATSSREALLRSLLSINVQPKNAQEIADYLYPRPVSQKPVAVEKVVAEENVDAVPPEEQVSVKELLQPITWVPPSQKYFDGAKTFCDSSGKWYYTVTIMKSNILLIKYPGEKNTTVEKGTAVIKTRAVINGEEIVSARNHPSNYKYENNLLYEKTEETQGWNKYVECVSK